jgi:electron transport complex protein RnfD
MNTPSVISVAPSPHLSDAQITTRKMMLDVLLALSPAFAISVWLFQWYAIKVILICVLSCWATEAICARMRKHPIALGDLSATITGVILGMSLPWNTPWYVACIGSVVAIALGKMAFGGLGMNLFNPAMVGRAFVMLSFAKSVGAAAYQNGAANLSIVTEATPLAAAKGAAVVPELWSLFIGNVNGSLGETSAIALLMGGIYLCIRRSAAWEIPLGVIIGAAVMGGINQLLGLSILTIPAHLFSGALLIGAFFIATDPCSSPLTVKGKFIFGLGVGLLIVILRAFSSYPEGVMFAILLMNAAVPLINRFTVPTPLGGNVPAPKKA